MSKQIVRRFLCIYYGKGKVCEKYHKLLHKKYLGGTNQNGKKNENYGW